MRKTKDQVRASHAWSAIQYLEQHMSPEERKKVGRAIKELPVRIQASGIGQAIAFLNAKGQTQQLEGIIVQWLMNSQLESFQANNTLPTETFIQNKIIESDAAGLRHLTDEALAYLPWLGRFAEGAGFMKD